VSVINEIYLGFGSTFVVDFSAEETMQNVVAYIPKKDITLEI
jgi:hypothetical protein